MFGDLFDSPWKILIVAVVIIVLFGSAKLPMAARSLGKSMRILKTEVHALHDDETPATAPAPAQIQSPPASAPFASPAASAEAEAAVPAHQAQIDALTKQLADLQQQQSASGSAQAK